MREIGAAVIVNLAGSTVDEYERGARMLSKAPGVDMIELNVSCPNVKEGGMAFGLDPRRAAEVTEAVRSVWDGPLMVKLSPNAPDIHAVAEACVQAGAGALSLVNTFKAMAIDVQRRRPVFDNVSAGYSGPAIKPIALCMVWELRRTLARSIPIVGCGGISGPNDALEFLLAGASAVQVGTAAFVNPNVMSGTARGIAAYMAEHRFERVTELPL